MSDVFTTPDGVFRVEFERIEMRMSHSVNNPRVVHVPSGCVLFDKFNTLWDGSPSVDATGRLVVAMREYPGSSPGYTLMFDSVMGTCSRLEGSKVTAWWTIDSMCEDKAPATSDSRAELAEVAAGGRDPGHLSDNAGTPPRNERGFLATESTLEPLPDIEPGLMPGSDSSLFVTAGLTERARRRRKHRILPAIGVGFMFTAIGGIFVVSAWMLATHTPLERLPAWAGWGLSVFFACLLTLGAMPVIAAIRDVSRTHRD